MTSPLEHRLAGRLDVLLSGRCEAILFPTPKDAIQPVQCKRPMCHMSWHQGKVRTGTLETDHIIEWYPDEGD